MPKIGSNNPSPTLKCKSTRADNRQWPALDGEWVVALSADPLHFIWAMIGSTGYVGKRDVVAASIGGQVIAAERVVDAARRERNEEIFLKYWRQH
jgi:hypothetical protein